MRTAEHSKWKTITRVLPQTSDFIKKKKYKKKKGEFRKKMHNKTAMYVRLEYLENLVFGARDFIIFLCWF